MLRAPSRAPVDADQGGRAAGLTRVKRAGPCAWTMRSVRRTRDAEENPMDEKDLERRQVVGVIGAGLVAALVAWLAVPSQAQAQVLAVPVSGHVAVVDTLVHAAQGQ